MSNISATVKKFPKFLSPLHNSNVENNLSERTKYGFGLCPSGMASFKKKRIIKNRKPSVSCRLICRK